jgi:Response regulator containing a CheY-like receiver domain and an HTH DNA-binding domain
MKQKNLKTDDYFEGIPISNIPIDEERIIKSYSDLSNMLSEALFVLDFQKRNFLFVPRHNLFLCGCTPEKVKKDGYDFFNFMLHPDDLQLWKSIHVVILKSLHKKKLPAEKIINFFECTFRIRNFLSEEGEKTDYLMVYLKIKPEIQNGIPLYGICLLSVSVVPEPQSMLVYYDNHDYSVYSLKSRKWIFCEYKQLSKREKQILVWSQAGLTNKEMAEKLHLSTKVIEKIKTLLFEEQDLVNNLNLNSFSKKKQYANNRGLFYKFTIAE